MDKPEWRRVVKRRRAELSVDSSGYCLQLHTFLEAHVPTGLRVVIFDAMPGEVDLSGLIGAHGDAAGRYAMTRTPTEGFVLTVHAIDVEMETHRYGYRQPVADAPTIADDKIGAVLVPGLAFDRNGGRLGHGMGYYDRFLARLGPAALRIGVTGDLVVERLPMDEFDVPMTYLATTTGVSAVPLPRSSLDSLSDD